MNLSIIASFVGVFVGGAFGVIYLGLLWVAVRSLPQDRSGIFVFLLLGLARVALMLGALMAAAALGLPVEGIAAGVVGFIAVRIIATRRLVREAPAKDSAWK